MNQKGIAPIVIILIIIGVLLAGGGIYVANQKFFIKKESPGATMTIAPTAISTAAVNTPQNNVQNSNKTPGGKIKVDCPYFNKGLEAGQGLSDKVIIPKDIAAMNPGNTLCGSIEGVNTTYYLTDSNNSTLLNYYKEKFDERVGCKTEDITQTQFSPYMYYFAFTCGDGSGEISVDAFYNAYYINFRAPRL